MKEFSVSIKPPEWVKKAVFYQIFPDRFANGDSSNDPINVVPWDSKPTQDNFFGGDLQGIIDHLEYIKELGINAIYLTPIFKARTNHKYDTQDYYSIDPTLGSKVNFKKLVYTLHKNDIKIILDGVFNHCGDGFWAFEDVVKNGEKSKYVDWYYFKSLPANKKMLNYQTCGGVSILPKLNLHNKLVREYVYGVARFWMRDFEIDGWRLDVPWKVSNDFWREFRNIMKSQNSDAYIVGEIWRDPSPWVTGETFDGIMNYPLRDCILDYLVYDRMDAEDFNISISRLSAIYQKTKEFHLNLLDSHDTPRLFTLCRKDIQRFILSYSFLLTYVGAPMIFYGDEIGLSGENDPDCRKPMVWNKNKWNDDIFQFIKKLISFRKNHPSLYKGNFEVISVFNGVFGYKREFDNDVVIILLNPRYSMKDFNLNTNITKNTVPVWKDLLTGDLFISKNGEIHFQNVDEKRAYIIYPEQTIKE